MIANVVIAAGLLLGHGSAAVPPAPVYHHGIESDATPVARVYNVVADRAHGWLLHWTFTCPDDVHGFIADVQDGSSAVVPVNEWGMNGSGEIEGAGSGQVDVSVVTACRWHMWVSEG